jgi:protein dithiol:quinone oxidoreductase
MFTAIIKQLQNLSHSRWYWILGIVTGIAFMAVALYYQHVLEEMPCLICIQIRLWISLFIVVSVAGLLLRSSRAGNIIINLAMVLIALGLVDRSYQLLGTERGFVFGDCGFELGLPGWFAIETWLPSVYRVETACGYTPELLFGITMAEALMVFSAGLLLLTVCVGLASLMRRE